MHQHGLPLGEAGPHGEREKHRQIVEQQSGTGLEADVIGQREHPVGAQYGGLGHGSADHRQAEHAVAGLHGCALRCRAHHAGQLGAEGEGQFRTVLIEPAGQQRVRKRHAGRVNVDDDAAVVGNGFVDLDQFQRLRAAERGDPDRTHQGRSIDSNVTCSSPRDV